MVVLNALSYTYVINYPIKFIFNFILIIKNLIFSKHYYPLTIIFSDNLKVYNILLFQKF